MVRPAGIKAMHTALAFFYLQGLCTFSPADKVDSKACTVCYFILFWFFFQRLLKKTNNEFAIQHELPPPESSSGGNSRYLLLETSFSAFIIRFCFFLWFNAVSRYNAFSN